MGPNCWLWRGECAGNEARCGRGRIGPTRSLLHRADEIPSAPVVNVGILVFRLVRRGCATMQPSSALMIMVALLRHLVAPNEACTHREVVLKKERARSPCRDGDSTDRVWMPHTGSLSWNTREGAAVLRLGSVEVPVSTSTCGQAETSIRCEGRDRTDKRAIPRCTHPRVYHDSPMRGTHAYYAVMASGCMHHAGMGHEAWLSPRHTTIS